MVCALYSSRAEGLLLDPEGQSCEDWTLEKKLTTLHTSYRIRVLSKDNISSYNHNMTKALEMAISTEDQKRLIETLHTFSWRFFFYLIGVFGFWFGIYFLA